MPIIDTFKVFDGIHRTPTLCRLWIHDLGDGRALIVCSERDDNRGASVTNAAEVIATAVCISLQLDPRAVVWVEHYPARQIVPASAARPAGVRERPTWDLVTFKLCAAKGPTGPGWIVHAPAWRPMTLADWQELGLAGPPEELG